MEGPFKCDYCEEEYSEEFDLLEHLDTHDKKPCVITIKLCRICKKAFEENDYINHVCIFLKENSFACHICTEQFDCEGSLNEHLEAHSDQEPSVSNICENAFTEENDINHCNRLKDDSYTCYVCHKGFECVNSFNEHLLDHSQKKPYKCLICGRSFPEKIILKYHILVHTKEKPCTCPTCSSSRMVKSKRTFAKKSIINRHALVHKEKPFVQHVKEETPVSDTSEKENSFTCNICQKIFGSASTLTKHVLDHFQKKPFNCPNCERSFPKKERLKNHFRVHTQERPFKCPICPGAFSKKYTMTRHLLSHKIKSFACNTSQKHLESPKIKPHKCEVCQKSFIQAQHLKKHSLIHTKGKPTVSNVSKKDSVTDISKKASVSDNSKKAKENSFTCNLCHKGFDAVRSFSEHLLGHAQKKPHKCVICGKSFPKISRLKYHIRLHTNEKPFECPICSKAFARNYIMLRHMLQHKKKIICNVCEEGFESTHDLYVHSDIHSEEKPYKCEICLRRFTRPDHLRRHSLSVHSDTSKKTSVGKVDLNHCLKSHDRDKTFECNKCEKEFQFQFQLTRHLRIHISEIFVCSICRKTSSDQCSFEEHLKTHSGEKPSHFKCNACRKEFTKKNDFVNHLVIHVQELERRDLKRENEDDSIKIENDLKIKTENEANYFSCGKCHEWFVSKSLLQNHLLSHSMKKNYKCRICAKTFAVKAVLTKHMLAHKGKRIVCSICHKDFVTSSNLGAHIRECHSGKRPFKCDECGKRFVRRTHLKDHSAIHTGVRPFCCKICGKKFIRKHVLSYHLRVHDRQKKFKCSMCSKRYHHRQSLNKHLRRAHLD